MSAPFDRPASEPGGCECFTCGVIFVGAEWHSECAVCAASVDTLPKGQDAQQGSVEDESAGRQALPEEGASPTPQHKE